MFSEYILFYVIFLYFPWRCLLSSKIIISTNSLYLKELSIFLLNKYLSWRNKFLWITFLNLKFVGYQHIKNKVCETWPPGMKLCLLYYYSWDLQRPLNLKYSEIRLFDRWFHHGVSNAFIDEWTFRRNQRVWSLRVWPGRVHSCLFPGCKVRTFHALAMSFLSLSSKTLSSKTVSQNKPRLL